MKTKKKYRAGMMSLLRRKTQYGTRDENKASVYEGMVSILPFLLEERVFDKHVRLGFKLRSSAHINDKDITEDNIHRAFMQFLRSSSHKSLVTLANEIAHPDATEAVPKKSETLNHLFRDFRQERWNDIAGVHFLESLKKHLNILNRHLQTMYELHRGSSTTPNCKFTAAETATLQDPAVVAFYETLCRHFFDLLAKYPSSRSQYKFSEGNMPVQIRRGLTTLQTTQREKEGRWNQVLAAYEAHFAKPLSSPLSSSPRRDNKPLLYGKVLQRVSTLFHQMLDEEHLHRLLPKHVEAGFVNTGFHNYLRKYEADLVPLLNEMLHNEPLFVQQGRVNRVCELFDEFVESIPDVAGTALLHMLLRFLPSFVRHMKDQRMCDAILVPRHQDNVNKDVQAFYAELCKEIRVLEERYPTRPIQYNVLPGKIKEVLTGMLHKQKRKEVQWKEELKTYRDMLHIHWFHDSHLSRKSQKSRRSSQKSSSPASHDSHKSSSPASESSYSSDEKEDIRV